MLVEDNFKIPDITIDPDIKPDSLRDYMTGNLFSLVRKLKKIEQQMVSDFVTKPIFDNLIHNKDQLIKSIQEDIDKIQKESNIHNEAIGSIKNEISEGLKPVVKVL